MDKHLTYCRLMRRARDLVIKARIQSTQGHNANCRALIAQSISMAAIARKMAEDFIARHPQMDSEVESKKSA